jgi:23S rRNA (cytidine1920-2'-O)/16S rRNA (cytidine1409-2'-O)-methyltransferase
VHDRTNVRDLGPELVGGPVDLVVADLSFISLRLVVASLAAVAVRPADFVMLIKPQFEAGPERVSRGGLVRDATARAAAVHKVIKEFEAQGFGTVSLARSPVAGRRAGNVEYPLWLLRDAETMLEEERILAVTGGGEP